MFRLIMVIALLFCVKISAQSQLTITCLDANSRTPIKDVYVNIAPINNIAISNELGKCVFKNLSNRKYVLTTSFLGYIDVVKQIDIKSTTNVVLVLKKSNESLEEVVVTGTRTKKAITNSPVLTRVVSAKEIENSGVVTALETIELAMPGVHFSPDPHGDNLRIQGLGNDYILVLIDGQKLIGEMRGNVNFSRIPVANIKQIEVIKGASSVLYGSNAIGGVINIITKDNKQFTTGEIEGRYGTYNEFLTQISGQSYVYKTGINLSLYRRSHEGYNTTSKNNKTGYVFNSYVDYSSELSLKRNITSKIKAKLNLRYYQHDLKNPPITYENEHKFTNNFTTSFNLDNQLSDNNDLEIRLHRDLAKRFSIVDANSYKYKKGHYDYNSIQVIDKQSIGEKSTILSGLEYSYEDVFSKNFSEERNQRRSMNTYNGFIQADIYLNNNFEAVAGGRYTYHETYGSKFTPSLSLMYKTGSFTFRGNIAQGYRSPSLKEMYYNFDHAGFWIVGNPDLKAETSITTSLSVEFTKKDLHFTASVFQNEIKNKIHYYMNSAKKRAEMNYKNFGKTQIRGIELNAKKSFFKNYNVQLGYTYTDAVDKDSGLQLTGNVKHSGNCVISWKSSESKNPLTINIAGRISSGRIEEKMVTRYNPVTKKHEEMLIDLNQDPYSLWRVNVSKTIKTQSFFDIMVYAGSKNIFNHTDSFLITPGRTYYGGFKLMLN